MGVPIMKKVPDYKAVCNITPGQYEEYKEFLEDMGVPLKGRNSCIMDINSALFSLSIRRLLTQGDPMSMEIINRYRRDKDEQNTDDEEPELRG